MTIIYTLISKNFNVVLAEYTAHTGNFQQITRILLYKLKNNYRKRGIIRYNKYIYSYITEDKLIYLCISDSKDDDMKINNNIYLSSKKKELNLLFSFLIDLKKHFQLKYKKNEIEKMRSYEINQFEKTISVLMDYYNNKPKETKEGDLILNISKLLNNLQINNINDYLNSQEIIDIIIIKNELINNVSLTNKNPVLSSYNCKKKVIRNSKICLKIIASIIIFFVLIYLLLTTFGKKEDFGY